MQSPHPANTSLTTPLGNTEKTAGLNPPPRDCPADPIIAPVSTTLNVTKTAELAPTGPQVASNRSPDPAQDKAHTDHVNSGKLQSESMLNCDSISLAQPSGAARGPPNSTTPNTNQQHTQTSHAGPEPTPPLAKLTIIKSDQIQMEVMTISQAFAVSKPTWSKYVATWQALAPLLQNCARACLNPPPSPSLFHLQRTACTYVSWIQTINSLADKFLNPSEDKQCYCLDILDLPLLASFGQKHDSLRPTTKIDHPEIVAASVELMADNLFNPPPVSSNPTDDHITRGVHALIYLNALKNSSSTFDHPLDQNNPGTKPTQRLHSVNQGPVDGGKKKANTRAN
ncbi:hypothetical protein PtB15_18B341 [Puccinia triticina]|nr:hypothetical protein PtB15_18B341 [Puccinia triticina]